MAAAITIDPRFRGPEESGNGGYSCGIVARFLEPAMAEVTLRLPPPLDRPLAVEAEDGSAVMRDGDAIVAEAEAVGAFELELPQPVERRGGRRRASGFAAAAGAPVPGLLRLRARALRRRRPLHHLRPNRERQRGGRPLAG